MLQRILWIDRLRVFAAFTVVWLHVSAQDVVSNPSPLAVNWWIANIADAGARWCVPIFIMISGTLLLPNASQRNIANYYFIRLSRLLFPLIFWTIFYISFESFQQGKIDFINIFKNLLLGDPYFHLWFLYMILGLYIIAPFIAVFVTNAKQNTLLAAIFIGFLFASCHTTINILRSQQSDIFMDWIPFVPYFIAGYTFNNSPKIFLQLTQKQIKIAVLISGSAIAIFTGFLLPLLSNKSWELMYNYLNPFVIIMTLGIFTIFQTKKYSTTNLDNIITLIAPFMLGVYLIHPLWIEILNNFVFKLVTLPVFLSIPIYSSFIFLFSLASCYLIYFIPGGKKVVT